MVIILFPAMKFKYYANLSINGICQNLIFGMEGMNECGIMKFCKLYLAFFKSMTYYAINGQ